MRGLMVSVMMLSAVLASASTWGKVVDSPSLALGLRDQQIYFETEKICNESQSLLGTFFNRNTKQAFWISAGEFFSLTLGSAFVNKNTSTPRLGLDFAASEHELEVLTANYRQHNLVGDYTYDRLQSAGFELALSRCYPDRPDLKRDFVISMLSADVAGKVPSLMLMLTGVRFSRALFTKFAVRFPRLAKTLLWSSSAGAIVYGILEVRRKSREREVTPEEHARVAQLVKGIREGRVAMDQLAIELSQKEIEEQEKLMAKATTDIDRQRISKNIEILKTNLIPLK